MSGRESELLVAERAIDPTISPERRKTLRRAEEALRRAEHWANWMESVEAKNTSQQYRSPASLQTAGALLGDGQSSISPTSPMA